MTQDDNPPVADEKTIAADTPATGAAADEAGEDTAGKDAVGKDGKAIWVGSAAVGIGSAALVAALMYARRRK
jgi:hypothetical protein